MPITVAMMAMAVAIRAQSGASAASASAAKNTGTPSRADTARETMTVSSPPRLSDNRCVGLAGYRHRGEFLERGSAARARRETWVPTARCRRTAR
jgi:hypothetical protein